MTEITKGKKYKKKFNQDESISNGVEGGAKPVPKPKNKGKFKGELQTLVKHKAETKWFGYQVDQKVDNPSADKLSDEETKDMFDKADILLKTDQDIHAKVLRQQGGSEASWLLSVVKKGTASDRMTAMQLQMHQSPVHSLPYVESMLVTLEKKNTREVMEIIPLLEEIYVNHFLPESRKLLSFSSRPLAKLDELAGGREQNRHRVLVLWMFEHKLKQCYERFIRGLEAVAAGVVEDLARRALKTALNLLAERPEAEQLLLTMLVNKLGHPNYRIGAYVATLLEELTRRQPNMIPVIIKETERLVYRKNVSDRALMYATTFMSQIRLRNDESNVPVHLLSIYFGLFKTIVARKKTDNKLLGILLAASNRAFPFAKNKSESLVEDINALYKVVHTSSFPVALQTLKLLFQVLDLSDSLSDRFYSALYKKLFVTIPQSSYNQFMLLLFRVLKADSSEDRIRSFIKRLLQIACGASASLAAAILILVSRIAEKRPGVLVVERNSNKVLTQVDFDEDDEERFVDLDVDGKPVAKLEIKADNESDEDEDTKDDSTDEKKSGLKGALGPSSQGGWVHKTAKSARSPYDPNARNPLFVDGKSYPDTELLLLSKHFHPSVAIFAQQLLQGQFISYKGDPLEDYTLMKFLDRFAYKNPKTTKASKTVHVARKKAYDPWGVRKLAVNSKEYLEKSASELPPDERYLHKFAQLKFQPREVKKEKEDEWEIESVGSEEFDRILDQFEPGEANEEFDIDYGQEFSAEKHKNKKSAVKRGAGEDISDGEDDELDEEDYEDDGEDVDDEDEDGDIDDDDDDEDDEDIEMESDIDDDEEERAFQRGKSGRGGDDDSGSDDDDFGDNDVEVAADRFGTLLEDFAEEDESKSKKKGKKLSKLYKRKQKKRR